MTYQSSWSKGYGSVRTELDLWVLAVSVHRRGELHKRGHTAPHRDSAIKTLVSSARNKDYKRCTHPDVNLWSSVLLSFEYLGSCVGWRTTPRGQLSVRWEVITETEVCNLDVHVGVHQQVFRLDKKDLVSTPCCDLYNYRLVTSSNYKRKFV